MKLLNKYFKKKYHNNKFVITNYILLKAPVNILMASCHVIV